LQASGRPDLTAKLHLVEVPCYLALLYWGIRTRGIEGAAIAWTSRLSIEAAVLFFLLRAILAARLWITMLVSTAILLIACGIESLALKFVFLAVSLSVFAYAARSWILKDILHLRLRSWIGAMRVLNQAKARFAHLS